MVALTLNVNSIRMHNDLLRCEFFSQSVVGTQTVRSISPQLFRLVNVSISQLHRSTTATAPATSRGPVRHERVQYEQKKLLLEFRNGVL